MLGLRVPANTDGFTPMVGSAVKVRSKSEGFWRENFENLNVKLFARKIFSKIITGKCHGKSPKFSKNSLKFQKLETRGQAQEG